MLKRLDHLGFVERQRDLADERRVLITLSDRGAALRDDAAEVPARIFDRFGMDLGAARELLGNLTRLVENLEAPSPPA